MCRTFRLSDIIPESKLLSKSIDNEVNKNAPDMSDIGSNELNTCDFFAEECAALQEIFPDTSILEIKHCITVANGDIDQATQIILDREEKGQSLTGTYTTCPKGPKIDDNELKNRIISRYGGIHPAYTILL